MAERSIEEEIKIKAQQGRKLARYMSSTQDLVENQIRKAQERGEFNNLEGSGKPISLEENPFEPPELRMTFKILKDNDFAPYWIELGKEIDHEIDKFWKEVEYFKRYTAIFYSQEHSSPAKKRFDSKKALFYAESRFTLQRIDKKIGDYNLHCPFFRMGRPNMKIDDEIYKVISSVEKLIEELKQNPNKQ